MEQVSTTTLSDPKLHPSTLSSTSLSYQPPQVTVKRKPSPISTTPLSATHAQVDCQDFSSQQHSPHSPQPEEMHTVTGRDTNEAF